MCHGLYVHEIPGSRVVDGGAVRALEGLVVNRAAHDHWPAIGKDHHPVTEHVPG